MTDTGECFGVRWQMETEPGVWQTVHTSSILSLLAKRKAGVDKRTIYRVALQVKDECQRSPRVFHLGFVVANDVLDAVRSLDQRIDVPFSILKIEPVDMDDWDNFMLVTDGLRSYGLPHSDTQDESEP